MKSIEQQFNEGKIEAIELENFSNSFERQLKFHEDELAKKTSESLEQIWNQLNSYVQEYGQEHGYDYILGATGDGGIMYASEAKNLNEEVISYINDKYNGK
jgi:outer membrane protein